MNISQYIERFFFQMRKGVAAVVTQDYSEANAKNGVQWEISRRLTGVASGARNTSIILTGDLPVDLKSRVFGYTGDGLFADIYESPTYTGGTEVGNTPYNMSRINPATKQFKVLTGFTLTDDGVQCGATIYALGPRATASQGLSPRPFGANRILEPNTAYLLTFTSLDTQPQDIMARLDMYEGTLDMPYSGTV